MGDAESEEEIVGAEACEENGQTIYSKKVAEKLKISEIQNQNY